MKAVLQKQWEAALNPTCETKRALTRLRALEDSDKGGKARDAELAFLSSSSVCWNRSVTAAMFCSIVFFFSISQALFFSNRIFDYWFH